MKRPRIFYGWVVVCAAFVSMALAFVIWNSFSVFLVAITADYGWSRGSVSLAFSLFTIVYGLSSPLTGIAVDRFGPRVVMPLGALLLAAGLFGASQIQDLWQLYLCYGLLSAVGVSAIGTTSNLGVLANWFNRRRGTATGIASAGIGVGTMLLVPAAEYITTVAGWRAAYIFLALVVALTVPAITFFFQRHRPEDMGLQPDGATASRAPGSGRPVPQMRVVDKAWAARNWTVRAAVGTRAFWLLFFGFMFSTWSHQPIMIHQVAYLSDRGFEPMLGAMLVGLVGLAASLGKVFWGWLSDRIGREGAYTLGMACVFFGIIFLGLVTDASRESLLYAYALFFGIGYGVFSPMSSAISADLFQGRSFASIYGLLWVGSGAGSSLGPWLCAALFDATGAYTLSFAVSLVAAVASVAAFWLAAPRKVRQVPGVAARAQRTRQALAQGR